MLRAIVFLAVVGVAGVAWGQTITVSGFTGSGGGWTTHTQEFNGTWSNGQVKPIRPVQRPPSQGPSPVGGMVRLENYGGGNYVVFYYNAGGSSFVSCGVFGLGQATAGTILPGGAFPPPGDSRRIVVQ